MDGWWALPEGRHPSPQPRLGPCHAEQPCPDWQQAAASHPPVAALPRQAARHSTRRPHQSQVSTWEERQAQAAHTITPLHNHTITPLQSHCRSRGSGQHTDLGVEGGNSGTFASSCLGSSCPLLLFSVKHAFQGRQLGLQIGRGSLVCQQCVPQFLRARGVGAVKRAAHLVDNMEKKQHGKARGGPCSCCSTQRGARTAGYQHSPSKVEGGRHEEMALTHTT